MSAGKFGAIATTLHTSCGWCRSGAAEVPGGVSGPVAVAKAENKDSRKWSSNSRG